MTARKTGTASRTRTARPTVALPGIPQVTIKRSRVSFGPKAGAAVVGLIWWWTTHPEQSSIITTALKAAAQSAASHL